MSTLNELAASSHADAARRGVYPQPVTRSLGDILGELLEARDEVAVIGDGTPQYNPGLLSEELADVLLCTLSTMHDLGVDVDSVVADKMAANRTRGLRA